jgi:hypothetical protein
VKNHDASNPPIPEETPVNHPENLLFGFLGAWVALILGLSLYQNEIQSRFQPAREPSSEIPSLIQGQSRFPVHASPASPKSDSVPAEAYLPFLY